jgi:hypothetical protein
LLSVRSPLASSHLQTSSVFPPNFAASAVILVGLCFRSILNRQHHSRWFGFLRFSFFLFLFLDVVLYLDLWLRLL